MQPLLILWPHQSFPAMGTNGDKCCLLLIEDPALEAQPRHEVAVFLVPAPLPFQVAKMFRGYRGQGLHLAAPHDEGQKKLCPENGPLMFGSLFKIPFFPRGKIFGFRWVGGLAFGGGGPQDHPPPPVDKHIPDPHRGPNLFSSSLKAYSTLGFHHGQSPLVYADPSVSASIPPSPPTHPNRVR